MWSIIIIYLFSFPLLAVFIPAETQIAVNLIFSGLSIIYLVIHKKIIKVNLAVLIVIVLYLNIIISSLLFSRFNNALNTSADYLFLFLLFYLANTSDTKEKKTLIGALVIGGTLVAVYSLRAFFILSKSVLSYLSEQHIDYSFATEFLTANRAFSPFITSNLLAGYLIMIIFLIIGLLFENKTKTSKLILIPGMSICLVSLFYTKSLGAWLTLFVSLIIFFIVTKKINRKALLLIFILLIIIITVIVIRSNNTLKITQPLFSLQQRASYWSDTIEIIKEYPFRGIGWGNFSSQKSLYSHNSFLQIWAEIGMLGILSWLIICFLFIYNNLKIIKNLNNKAYHSAFFCAGLSFIIHNVIDFSFYIPQVAFIWWVILGLTTRSFGKISFNNHKNSS